MCGELGGDELGGGELGGGELGGVEMSVYGLMTRLTSALESSSREYAQTLTVMNLETWRTRP